MGRMDATLFVHPAQQMDCNSQKKDQMDCKFLKDGLNMCHIFGGWNVGQQVEANASRCKFSQQMILTC